MLSLLPEWACDDAQRGFHFYVRTLSAGSATVNDGCVSRSHLARVERNPLLQRVSVQPIVNVRICCKRSAICSTENDGELNTELTAIVLTLSTLLSLADGV